MGQKLKFLNKSNFRGLPGNPVLMNLPCNVGDLGLTLIKPRFQDVFEQL